MFATWLPERVGKAEGMRQLGYRSGRTWDYHRKLGLIPEGRLERPLIGRGGYRRTWSTEEIAEAAARLACSGLSRERKNVLDAGRERARMKRLERRDLHDLAAQVVMDAGPGALLAALRPVNGDAPLRDLPTGMHSLARVALISALRGRNER